MAKEKRDWSPDEISVDVLKAGQSAAAANIEMEAAQVREGAANVRAQAAQGRKDAAIREAAANVIEKQNAGTEAVLLYGLAEHQITREDLLSRHEKSLEITQELFTRDDLHLNHHAKKLEYVRTAIAARQTAVEDAITFLNDGEARAAELDAIRQAEKEEARKAARERQAIRQAEIDRLRQETKAMIQPAEPMKRSWIEKWWPGVLIVFLGLSIVAKIYFGIDF